MIQDMFNPTFALEATLILTIAGFIGFLLQNYIADESERQRRALHRQRIQRFLDTADKIELAAQQLATDIPAEAMQEILRQATIEDLYRIQTAIAKANTATQRLNQTHAGQIGAIAKQIGIGADQPSQPNNNGNGQGPTNGSANNNGQNGANPEKAGRKMIGQMLSRISANGKNLDFEETLKILRDQHGIENPGKFAALPEQKRQEIEALLAK
jgi:hypothetical protein